MDECDDFELPNEAFAPNRKSVNIEVGAFVQRGETIYRVTQVLDFESVIGVEVETGRSVPLLIGDLRCLQDDADPKLAVNQDLAEIADDDWRIAQQRFAAISPLVGKTLWGRDEVERQAKACNIDPSTLYRWLKRYNAYGSVTALIPKKRGWLEGKSRIPPHAEQVIEETIRDYYLTVQRPTAKKTIQEVQRRCAERGIQAPNHMTIRSRITKLSEKERLRGRGFKEKAKNKFLPAAGRFPNADYPLAVVQIDHTPADIILVDDVFRKPIGRPWITLAMDINTRIVTGYYLSFDPPSETSVAMCVAHSMLPKDDWLLLHTVDAQWPVWGKPRTIHVDNGADFRSNNFQQSCLAYGINLEFRPVKQPQYGGHIERMLGTLLREIHGLPGTTFSSIKERDGYDAEKHAAMTKSEFETWLVTLISKFYHQRLHSAIGMTPLKKWEIGIFGNAEVQGIGVPPKPTDRLTVLLDFLPAFRRTVQTFGVTIDGVTYYAEALRPWINSTDSETGKKLDLVFRRDPRDISTIWFFDPTLKQYFKIPFSDQALPAMSIWEYEQAREKLKREGLKSINEFALLRAITELRSQVEDAKEKTKRARRQAQRRKEHEKNISPAVPLPPKQPSPTQSSVQAFAGLVDGDIDTFGDIA
ncbi:transposase [Parazoarcus communis]|uniref:Transposase n=1 Tax=Parazoarcus communis TaxID=41977 RepID=A0A2U8H0Q4_9RHOO|nr:Mu transposase C-terminal domain-containing protein [Parazoarcus communis]AWI79471.1 transposase [Parazoarcus communis]